MCVLCPSQYQHMGRYRRLHCQELLSATDNLTAQQWCNSLNCSTENARSYVSHCEAEVVVSARQNLITLWGRRPVVVERDMSRKVEGTWRPISRSGRRICLRWAFTCRNTWGNTFTLLAKTIEDPIARIQTAWEKFKSRHQVAHERMPCDTLTSDLTRRKAASEM
jgi:hypothetical protein